MQLEVNGQRAFVYTGSRSFDPGLPCVVFIHGGQLDHSVWALMSRYLAHHGYGVLAMDLPGHGRSAGPPLTHVEAMADWLRALLQQLGPTRVVLVGHSMGSLIALHAAGQHPKSVAGLILLGSAYPMKVSDALLSATRDDEARAMSMINGWSHSGINHHPGFPAPGFSVYMQNLRLMQRQAPGVLHQDFKACNAYAEGQAMAQLVQCPVLMIAGQRDQMTPPRAARDLAQRLRAEWVELPGCGHNMMAEQPEPILRNVRSFLAAHMPTAVSTAQPA